MSSDITGSVQYIVQIPGGAAGQPTEWLYSTGDFRFTDKAKTHLSAFMEKNHIDRFRCKPLSDRWVVIKFLCGVRFRD